MTSKPFNHPRVKRIDVVYHYVRNKVEDEAVKLIYILIDQMMTDGLTKPLKTIKLLTFRSMMGLAPRLRLDAGEHKSMNIHSIRGSE